jgi:diguanylate cyclase (GGDEF)-like protein/PAS domain S-box-containing protein
MRSSPRHRAAGAGLRELAASGLAAAERPMVILVVAVVTGVLAALVVVVGGAASGRMVGVPEAAAIFAATVATVSAGVAGTVLIRLALRIHARVHAFGPCRGAGFLGLGTVLAAATAAAGGISAAIVGRPIATTVVQVGALATAMAYVSGLLLLPGAAPTPGARLRHVFDGAGVGCAVFLVAWLLLLTPRHAGSPSRPDAPAILLDAPAVLLALVASLALATTTVTGLRAVRHRPAALTCASGVALTVLGICLPGLGRQEPAWLVAAGLALAGGPALMVAGAGRADEAHMRRQPGGGPPTAQPVLAGPVAAAIGVSVYHVVTGGRFDPVAVAVGLALASAVAIRETLAVLDVRSYASRLGTQQARFQALVAGSADVTMVLDTDLLVRWQSPAAARRFGLSDQDVLDRPFIDLVHADDAAGVAAHLTAILATGSATDDAPVRARLRDGFGAWRDTESTVRDLRGAPEVGALVVHVRDVADLAGLQRRLEEAIRTDPLTGLSNEQRLLDSAAGRAADGARAAFVVLSLHGLTGVNELHGTAVGDEVLVATASRLVAASDGEDIVARLGGNRLAVLTSGSALRAYPRAVRLVDIVTSPYNLSCGGQARLTADAGVADVHEAIDAGSALRHAGSAATRARDRGPGRVELYDDGLAAVLRRRAAIEQRLPDAIDSGDFDLVYQPVLDLRHRQPVAVEALLRWRLPDLGTLPAMEVVSAAEKLGCVAELDARVLRRACRKLALWRLEGYDVPIAVNLSPHHFRTEDVAALVADALGRTRLPADRLIVEVAARDLPDDAAPQPMEALRSLGVRVALDHFGSGALGLARLPTLPVDMVKVDRLAFADPATALVDVVVGLGARFGFEVAAVGVETRAEVSALRAAGCHTAQGLMLSPPAHHEHVEAVLEHGQSRLY